MSTPTDIISKIFNSSNITSRFEAVYVAFHASLIANGFKCIGLEDEVRFLSVVRYKYDDLVTNMLIVSRPLIKKHQLMIYQQDGIKRKYLLFDINIIVIRSHWLKL